MKSPLGVGLPVMFKLGLIETNQDMKGRLILHVCPEF